jgi:hypothetical protein
VLPLGRSAGFAVVIEIGRLFGDEWGERVIGTYLYPLRLFGFGLPDPRTFPEVIRTFDIGELQLLVTRMSGLFVRPPGELPDVYRGGRMDPTESDLHGKIRFEERAALTFNTLICELALLGLISEPASPLHIEHAKLIDGHALITAGTGGREMYNDRTSGPALALITQGGGFTWARTNEAILDNASACERALRLARVSESLVTLIPAAYSLYSQRQLAEALIDSWIVCEQLLDSTWRSHVDSFDSARRKRLDDQRTFSPAVRIELLQTAGAIPDELAAKLHRARRSRNEIAHRASISLDGAAHALDGMKAFLEFVLGSSIAAPAVSQAISW